MRHSIDSPHENLSLPGEKGTLLSLAQYAACVYDPSDIVEVRMIRVGGQVESRWTTGADLPDIADDLASANSDGWNIYAGVSPRPRQYARGDECIDLARVVFVDFDNVGLLDARRKWDAAGLPEPTIVIESGHGIHAYWRLARPIDDLAAWSAWQWDAAVMLGGDPKCRNPERVMRLPGFNNLKSDPVPCRIVQWDATRRAEYEDLRQIVSPRPSTDRPAIPQRAISGDVGDPVRRCMAYLSRCPDSIQLQDGSGAMFRAAMETQRFGLGEADAMGVLGWFSAAKSSPPWSEKEIRHKLDSAREKCNGEFGIRLREDRKREAATHRIARAVDAPDVVASSIVALADAAPRTLISAYLHEQRHPIAHFRDTFYRYSGTCWREVVTEELRAELADWAARQLVQEDDSEPRNFRPNRHRVSDLLDSLAAMTQVHRITAMPAWLDTGRPSPAKTIAFENGILNVDEFIDTGKIELRAPTPKWFSSMVLPYSLRADAPAPDCWRKFLGDLWLDDPQAVELLQEFAGLCLTSDTSYQKLLGLIGPPRSGKSTIARVFTAMIGPENIAGPTLAGLGTNFGLWGLLNRTLAIVSDARLGNRTDQAIVVERLLSITGEDTLLVDRKNREPISTRLPTKIILISNELPRFIDSSGALASRFLLLTLRKSFLGNEDIGLTDRLIGELPSIALWALHGLRRLKQRGHFIEPSSSREAAQELDELASPIRAFIRERCTLATGQYVEASRLFEAWRQWCSEQGRDHPGTVQTFGRDLRAAAPVAVRQPRIDGAQVRVYDGIGVRP